MTAETVRNGKVVTMHYTLKGDDGEVIDSTAGEEPMAYLHGASNIVPGLERQMQGKNVGDAFEAVVAPEDGYGLREGDPITLPRNSFPDDVELEEGTPVMLESDDGDELPAWITEITDEHVVLDPNHPLAGVTLHFSIQIEGIRDATDEERAHGHVHGPGGHH